MAKRKQNGSGPRTDARAERQLFLAGLFRKGVARSDIYRVVTAKFGVTEQTVRKDISALGLAVRKYYEDEKTLDAEVGAAIDRLKKRAQRDDSTGNRADELLLNLYGMRSAKKYEMGLKVQKQRIEEARASLLELQAEQARVEVDRIKAGVDRDNRFTETFQETIARIREQRAASVKDLLELTCLFLETEMAKGASADTRQILSSLRHLTQISLSDPSSAGAEHQLFTLPEGMRWDSPPKPDEGDDLVAND